MKRFASRRLADLLEQARPPILRELGREIRETLPESAPELAVTSARVCARDPDVQKVARRVAGDVRDYARTVVAGVGGPDVVHELMREFFGDAKQEPTVIDDEEP